MLSGQIEDSNTQFMIDALKELKLEMENLRKELSRIEGSILRERVKAVEEALSQNRLLLYADQLSEELDEDLAKIVDPECENRLQCVRSYKGMATESINLTKNAKPADAINDLDSKIEKIGSMIQKANGSSCEICHRNFQKKLKREKRAFQTIVLVEKTSANDSQKELNIANLVETILEPLANTARLKMVISLSEGKKSFSKLTQITSLKGGHLIFHIKKLLDAGLVAQEDNKGDYIITPKGVEAAKKVSMLQKG